MNICKAGLEGGNDIPGVVDRQGGLGDVGHWAIRRQGQGLNLFNALNKQHRPRDLPHRALDLGVAGVADQDQGAALADVALPLIVNFRDQRAGGIEHRKVARGGLFLDAAGDAMGAEDRDRFRRNLGQFLDEDCAFVLQALDHVFVMHDLMAHVDGWAVLIQRPFHDLDRTHHACAEAARLRQINFHWTPITQVAPIRFKVPGGTPIQAKSCNIRTIGSHMR